MISDLTTIFYRVHVGEIGSVLWSRPRENIATTVHLRFKLFCRRERFCCWQFSNFTSSLLSLHLSRSFYYSRFPCISFLIYHPLFFLECCFPLFHYSFIPSPLRILFFLVILFNPFYHALSSALFVFIFLSYIVKQFLAFFPVPEVPGLENFHPC